MREHLALHAAALQFQTKCLQKVTKMKILIEKFHG